VEAALACGLTDDDDACGLTDDDDESLVFFVLSKVIMHKMITMLHNMYKYVLDKKY